MKNRRRTHLFIPLLLFAFLAALYGLTMQGAPSGGDGEGMFLVARSLALHGNAALEPDASIPMLRGRNGRLYSKFAPGLPLFEAPFIWAAARLMGPDRDAAYDYALLYFAATLSVALSAALCVAALYFLILDLGYAPRTAAAAALACGAGAMLWPYAGFGFSEPLQALCVVGAFYAARRAARGPHAAPWALLSGACAGWLGLTKPSMFVCAPLLLAYMLAAARAARSGARPASALAAPRPGLVAAAWVLPLAALLCATLYYNWMRFGAVFDFGYTGYFDREQAFGAPLLTGLYGLLFSPGKSVFLYAPAVVLGLAGARRFHRAHPRESALCWAVCAACVLLYARWWAWHGDWAWGPRFLVPVLPLALVPAAAVFEALPALAWWKRAGAALIVAASLGVQALGACVHYGNHLYLVTRVLPVNPFFMSGQHALRDGQLGPHFVPELSPVAGHAWLLRHAAAPGGADPAAMARTAPWRTLLATPDAMPPPDMLRAAARIDAWHVTLRARFPARAQWALPVRNALAAACLAAALALLRVLGADAAARKKSAPV
jgi:hypothetical protein